MYHRNNCFMNDTNYFRTKSHAFSQQAFSWIHSILFFLQVLCHVTNHRFNIFCFINYKMGEVKKYRYLRNPQLIFDTQTYTQNPYLTQCQSILLMAPLCMLKGLFQDIPMISNEHKKN